jgi:ribosomal protein S7
LPLNIDFYRTLDGVYGSYWTGKLISTLQREGKKKTVMRHFYRGAAMIKLSTGLSPLLLLLETLDKIKPTFRLRNRIRRTTIKEYPIVVLKPRRIILAIHWLKEEIQSSSGVFGTALGTEIAGKLLDFKLNPKKNNLIKKRNEYTKRTVKAQFNMRYNFK